jgi:hypothetical protein
MTSDNALHNWSDAWLLLAILYADQQGNATLAGIIGAGDAINVAIFTVAELESGLARLTRSGFIEENAGLFVPTKKTQLQTKLGHTRRSMHNELKDVAKLLGCPSAIGDQPSQDNLRYPGFSISVYEGAVETYRHSVQSVV